MRMVFLKQIWTKELKEVDSFKESDILSFDRDFGQILSQWKRIHVKISRYVGAYAHAEPRRKSGESNDDVMKIAFVIYKRITKQTLKCFIYCWEILGLAMYRSLWEILSKLVKRRRAIKKVAQRGGGSMKLTTTLLQVSQIRQAAETQLHPTMDPPKSKRQWK